MNNISHPDELVQFFKQVAAEIREEGESFDSVCQLMEPVLNLLQKKVQSGSILILPTDSFNTLEAFARIPEFASVKTNLGLKTLSHSYLSLVFICFFFVCLGGSKSEHSNQKASRQSICRETIGNVILDIVVTESSGRPRRKF